ncbi:type 1 glutamine amidotransferase [Sphingomonas montana]|uniref:type 1 glutamine amidotransferase n=1 Tax=Sphingomonas montana TaxID=1843236 RepID=UPI00096E7AE9|nr:type 1 glutamine amidotransferase [Sphingomonas montana]
MLRFLIAESETKTERDARRAHVGTSSGETYIDTLRELAPGAACDRITPADPGAVAPDAAALTGYDAVFITGSPLHVYDDSPEVRRQLDFMRAVFASGTPAFGSCAGLQVAVAAAGGRVRAMGKRQEAGFARRITPTAAGRDHPLLGGRPAAYDAPAIHGDEVEALPADATLLASNSVTAVQAAEIRHDGGIFWGVQYHPELSLGEIAVALRRQQDDLIEQGLVANGADLERQAALIETLGDDPTRHDLAWQLGLNEQVVELAARRTELRNFIDHLVARIRRNRGRA